MAPTCQAQRRYTVVAEGDVLDAERHDVGDVRPEDVFLVGEAPEANPYRSRYFGRVAGTSLTGYVDQAKLRFTGVVCR